MLHLVRRTLLSLTLPCALLSFAVSHATAQDAAPRVVLPLERTAYFVGEKAPLGFADLTGQIKLEAVLGDVRTTVYEGPAGPLMLDTTRLAPGDYRLEANGKVVLPRLTLVVAERKSRASMQDEATPREPQFPQGATMSPEERKAFAEKHWDGIVKMLEESGVSAVMNLGSIDTPRYRSLDALARAGTLVMANPDSRPTSFLPTRNAPEEVDSMTQRLLLSAQANGRYPNFGGFCYGWDTTGFPLGSRRMLLIYWGWGDQEQNLMKYIERIDAAMCKIFTERTGFQPITETEYLAYPLALGRPDFATMIDLPTKIWLEQIAKNSKPMNPEERAKFEQRLDAWSSYLMNMYGEVYGQFSTALKKLYPSMNHTASVQVDHSAVRNGQYFPSAYKPLDFQYQSTWNDQVGGPDYAYQWLYTQALLDMERGARPTWISNSLACAHHRADYPGKFARTAAHGLAYGATGIGYALEGFSNVLGGMAAGQTGWDVIRDQSGGADVRAGRDFLDRFASLAIEGRGEHGVAILFSKSQYQRQHSTMGFGHPNYKMLVALTRLGYTPCFLTEDELAAGKLKDVKALLVLGQTFPLPEKSRAAIDAFTQGGGLLLKDENTTVELPGAKPLAVDLSAAALGKPFNWMAPNMPAGDNDTFQYAAWYKANAPKIVEALGDVGLGLLKNGGPESNISLLEIDGGRDAKYIVAVNDSHVKNQADWHQVRETLTPTSAAPQAAALYDLTQEKGLGPFGSVDCDLTAATARVYGVLARPVKSLQLAATQKRTAGESVAFALRVLGDDGQPIEAVVPVHLALVRPDGKVQQELYRATGRDGVLAMSLPTPTNVPTGKWSLIARSQLDGMTATLPIEVAAAPASMAAQPLKDSVVVRGRAVIEPLLARGQKLVVPIFDSPQADQIAAVAEKLKATLASRGVEVEIRRNPPTSTYWLAYDLTPEQQAENLRAERGEAFGQLKRTTLNGNDWTTGLSGWRFHQPVLLLDLASEKDNPMAEALTADRGDGRDAGLLWPLASAAFPGPGKAVVHGVEWAFGPRTAAIVIQADDIAGLTAGVEALPNLPADVMTESVEAARKRLWSERGVGAQPPRPETAGMTSEGLQAGHAPQAWTMAFPQQKPPTAAEAQALDLSRKPRAAVAVPAVFEYKQFVPFMFDGERLVEASSVEFLNKDLRFNQAVQLIADVPQAGKTKVIALGQFRYSDATPMNAAQWADVLVLYNQIVPKERRPMEIEVVVGGKSVGKLLPSRTERRDMPLEMKPSHGEKEVRKSNEEVVVELSGEVELPAGRQEIFLIHRNMVDGQMERVGVGVSPDPPAPVK